MLSITNSKRRKIDSIDRSISISQSNQEKYVIHNCLTLINKKVNLEDSLKLLLDCYLEAPYTFNDEGFLPIHLACIYHPTNIKVMDTIMRANPSGVMNSSKFPLVRPHMSTSHSKAERYHGTYPLHMAVINGASLDVIQLLFFQDPETLVKKDINGNTPLSIAIKYNADEKVFHFLLAQNEMLSTVSDNRMNTPLHIACIYSCCKEIVETLLLSAPGALNIKNRDGLKPFDLAIRCSGCSDEIIDLLQEALYHVQEYVNDIDV